MRAIRAATVAVMLVILSACGSTATPVMPDLRGDRLDQAKQEIADAGFSDGADVTGGGLFGVIDEANWLVCEQTPAPGDPLVDKPQLSVDRECPDLTPSPEPTDVATLSPSPTPPVESPTATPAAAPVTFVAVTDGDTIQTSAGAVRIIGIDTPEAGECGHDEASMAIGKILANGDPITLGLPAGQNDADQYGRLIRYVDTTSGVDLGLMQLQAGNAVARYDSTDGYPWHPREAAYHEAQVAQFASDGSVLTTACQNAPPAVAPVADTPEEDPWWEKYSSCTRLKKNTVGDPKGPFRKGDPEEGVIYDWFESGTGNNGDGDDDGLACE